MEHYLPYIVSILSIIFAGITLFKNSNKDNTNTGERWGRLEEKIDRLLKDIEKLDDKIENQDGYIRELKETFRQQIEETKKETKDSITRIHSRIDGILNKELKE